MPRSNLHHPLVLNVLEPMSTAHLQKAVSALAAGNIVATFTRRIEAEARALVKNGSGKEYGVRLTEAGAFCKGPEALYRRHVPAYRGVGALRASHPPGAGPDKTDRRTCVSFVGAPLLGWSKKT